jgi:phosphoglycolate phosphatase-like HAD superfamily hydrolase
MILLAMERFGITDAKEVAKIGDSIIDIEEGRNAGCGLSIGITTGAHTAAQLATANPDFIIHHLVELLPIIN